MSLSRELMKQQRIVMMLGRRGLKNVISLGRYNHTVAMPGLVDHSHRDCIEICFLVKGCQTYLVHGQSYRMTGGDVFLTFPGERHSTGGDPQEKGVLYWMILRMPKGGERLLDLPKAQSSALMESLLKIQHRKFGGSWKMKEHLDAVTNCFHCPSGALNTLAMSNHVVSFLLEVASVSQSSPEGTRTRPLQPVLKYIEEHLGEPASLAELARIAGLSVARFKARFKQETGMPPAEYVLRARVEEAEQRLKDGRSNITDIAYDLGFSTSQYFATVFKRFIGQTPSAFKAGIPLAVTERPPKL